MPSKSSIFISKKASSSCDNITSILEADFLQESVLLSFAP